MGTLLLNKTDVGDIVDLDKVLDAVEDGYRSFQKGSVTQPNFIDLYRPGGSGLLDIKAGLDAGSGRMSIKASSGGYANNPAKGLPTGINLVTLYDSDTSEILCIMDGTWITGCRTAAAGAISVKYLARKDASKIAILGSGKQARWQIRAISRVRKLTDVYVWGRTAENANAYADEIGAELGLNMHVCETSEEAVRNADIVVTATRAGIGPIVKREWVKPGTHIVAVGTDTPGKQELDADVFPGARIVCDSIDFCQVRGDLQHPLKEKLIQLSDVYGEIGEILLGEKSGRADEDEITIFDTVGMPIQDLAMANYIYSDAKARGLGTDWDFMA